MNSHKVMLASVLLLSTTGSCTSDDDSKSNAPRMQVVLDYSPTLSDAGALLYLASNPRVDLLAVTLPGTGEADCEPGTRTTRALLKVAGKDDVPVGCGRNEPLVGDRDWPDEWRAAANSYGADVLPDVDAEAVVDAEQLLADTLRAASEPVTLIAVGPLTNLGVVLGDHPELATNVARIVVMGGAVTVPGNVEAAPTAEWNIYIDPEAARVVIASGIPVTFVALDATNFMSWTERLVARIGALDSEAAKNVHTMASTASLDGFYLWDELAAMAAVEPTLVTIESMTVTIDDDGAVVRDPAGHTVDIAISADTPAAMDEFVKGLNRGNAPADQSLTAAELDYMVALGGADSDASAGISSVFGVSEAAGSDPHTQAEAFINGFLDAIESLANEVRDVSPPSALAEAHAEYLESLDALVVLRGDALTLIAASDGTTVDEILGGLQQSEITEEFNRIEAACQALVDYSFLRNGPRPCSFGG